MSSHPRTEPLSQKLSILPLLSQPLLLAFIPSPYTMDPRGSRTPTVTELSHGPSPSKTSKKKHHLLCLRVRCPTTTLRALPLPHLHRSYSHISLTVPCLPHSHPLYSLTSFTLSLPHSPHVTHTYNEIRCTLLL